VAGQTNVLVQGEALELTRKEALLLEQLLRAGGDSLSKRQLWQRWPGGVSLWQPVDSQAERLGYVRVALSDRAAQADLIRLQRGLLLVGRRMVRLAFLPLQHKVSALQRFTADASHELRHPLTALRAQLAAVPTELRQQPAMAWSELDGLSPRLGDLLDDLLLLARQEQAGLDGPLASAELQAFDLLELLEDLLRCYTPQAAARDIQLELSPDPTCRSVPCPTQDRERVFERFWSGADRGGHSGLGLAIGRAIARRHGGELRLGESRAGRCELVVALPAMDGR
jgi:signal transduction histidine kinase